jgi:AcrR family transcriptional regulator
MDVSTVNMATRTYHHGDLRSALLEAGLTALAEGGELSLRALAREAGVSPTAVYRHFPDKGALLAALAAEGLAKLATAQREASERAGGGAAGFSATGAAYVRFALDHPALFRLVFAHPPEGHRLDKPDAAMTMLRANAEALAPPGTDARLFALRAWAIAHGLAMLMLDGQVPRDDALIEGAIDVAAMRLC